MDIKITNVNTLPVPTWRWLKLNDTTVSCSDTGNFVQIKPQIDNLTDDVELTHQKKESFPEINTGMGNNTKEFAQNHAAQINFFTVKENAKIEEPIILTYKLADNNFFVDDNYIVAKKNSKATIVIAYTSEYNAGGFHGSSVKIYAEENAQIEVVQLQTLGKNYTNFDDIGAGGADNAVIKTYQIELGSNKNWIGTNIDLTADKMQTHLKNSYLAKENQALDINYVVNIWGKKTDSTIISKGILMNNAKKTLRGTLDFKRGSKGSVGNESEEVLLLDPDIQNKSIPLILCSEEDIEGNHSASIGEIDEQQLFYLYSRGLNDAQIRHMQIESKIQLICNELPQQLHSLVLDYKQEAFKDE